MRQVLINRKKWCRGRLGEYGTSMLLNQEGNMCCLGFACNQLYRIKKTDLRKCYPKDIYKLLPKNSVLIKNSSWANYDINSEFSQDAALINDRGFLSEKQREKQLTKLFAKNDIELTFKGE